jgi:uncharacterized membrane protein YkvA (DUF1232 family)
MGLMSRLFLLRRDLIILWRAFWHADTPRRWKGAMILMVLYVLSPLDIIPEFFGILGIIDDLVLIPVASRFIVSRLPEHVRTAVDPKGHRSA